MLWCERICEGRYVGRGQSERCSSSKNIPDKKFFTGFFFHVNLYSLVFSGTFRESLIRNNWLREIDYSGA